MCQIQDGCARAVAKPVASMKRAVYQVTIFFFFQAEQAVLQLVSFCYSFLSQNYHPDIDMEV